MLDMQCMNKIKENCQHLKLIIESIMFIGYQNIALRGHRDDGYLFSSSFSIDLRSKTT
jgi:hypothetical protein